MKLALEDLEIFVISIKCDSNFRNLSNQLKSLKINFVEALTPLNIDYQSIGKKISNVEIAISMSHHKARVAANRKNSKWAVFLEEDAIIKFSSKDLLELIENVEDLSLGQNCALGIHLFPEQLGVLKRLKQEKVLKVKYLPDFAVGYVLNSVAIESCIHNFNKENIELADWPLWMRREISWFAPTSSLVMHPDLSSPTTNSATKSARSMRMKKFRNKGYLSKHHVVAICLKIINLFSKKYGDYPIPNEKIRSIIL